MREPTDSERAFVALTENWAFCKQCGHPFESETLRQDGWTYCQVCALRNNVQLLDKRQQLDEVCIVHKWKPINWAVTESKITELLEEILSDGPNHR